MILRGFPGLDVVCVFSDVQSDYLVYPLHTCKLFASNMSSGKECHQLLPAFFFLLQTCLLLVSFEGHLFFLLFFFVLTEECSQQSIFSPQTVTLDVSVKSPLQDTMIFFFLMKN